MLFGDVHQSFDIVLQFGQILVGYFVRCLRGEGEKASVNYPLESGDSLLIKQSNYRDGGAAVKAKGLRAKLSLEKGKKVDFAQKFGG